MSYFVRREHLIGDKRVPYELPCEVVALQVCGDLMRVEIVTPSGAAKGMTVGADQVYFKLESV